MHPLTHTVFDSDAYLGSGFRQCLANKTPTMSGNVNRQWLNSVDAVSNMHVHFTAKLKTCRSHKFTYEY